MSCEPQGYKIKVSDFLEANENWIDWQKARWANTKIFITEKVFNSFANKYIFKKEYGEVAREVVKRLSSNRCNIFSFFAISDMDVMLYNWREPDYETFRANIIKANLIQNEFMWVDWEVLEFVSKNSMRGRNADGSV